MRAFVSWSGGKDCTLALHHFLSNPLNEVSYLVHFATDGEGPSKYHRFGKEVFNKQSLSIGIPLIIEEVSNQGYEYHLRRVIRSFREEGIEAGVFGDIFLEEHRIWIEKICKEEEVTPIFPLWGKKSLSVIEEFCQLGYKARVTGVKEGGNFAPLMEREIDSHFIKDICTIEGADPCGENGEYHTMAYDGPLFSKKIVNSLKKPFIILFTLLSILLPQIGSSEVKYKKIISLTPSITQSIYYLGAQEFLAGCTSYCHVAKNDGIEVVSSSIKPNLEKIAKLKPDLVLASGMISERDVNTLRRLGIKVEIFNTPKSFKEICIQFKSIGILTGKERIAEDIIQKSKERVHRIQDQMKKSGISFSFFIQIGASPIFTVIPDTFMNDYILFSNGINIASSLRSGTVGREFIVSRNPDYIFIVTMGITGEHEEALWREFTNMKAVKQNNIFVLESELACQPTPITFAETLEIIHSKISQK
ncbi:MAG: diphthine--ammonia ligase [Bacteroidales bacterium]|nr:diphthine--ammonia ligase [Bacteroidales bacterium]